MLLMPRFGKRSVAGAVSLVTVAIAGAFTILMLLASQAGATISEFPIPNQSSAPKGITTGPDGNLWFTEEQAGIGRVTPTGQFSEFPLPANSYPFAITTGPDGNLWFTEGSPARIARITPAGAVTEFPLGGKFSRPNAIAAGPDGNLWFTIVYPANDAVVGAIGRITPAGVITEFPLPQGQHVGPYGIAAGPDGNLWFTEFPELPSYPQEPKIGRITPAGQITKFPLPSESYGRSITAGPDGNLWFTGVMGRFEKFGFDTRDSFIGRMTTQGTFTEFPLPAQAQSIAAGPDGNLWFTETYAEKIGRISPIGKLVEFSIAPEIAPYGITAGPDGNLWFTTGWSSGTIGRISPDTVTVQLNGRRAIPVHGHRAKLKLACVGGTSASVCSGTVRLTLDIKLRGPNGKARTKTIVLAHRHYTLAAESQRRVSMRLSDAAMRRLARHHRLAADAFADTQDEQSAEQRVVLHLAR